MKEEVFHFYRSEVKPRLAQIKKIVLFSVRKIPLVRPNSNNKPKETTPKTICEYLLIKNSNNAHENDDRIHQNLHPTIIDSGETWKLNPNTLYFAIGKYDHIFKDLNYLRDKGFKVCWDQSWMEPDNHKAIWKRRNSVVEAIYTDLIVDSLELADKSYVSGEQHEWLEDFEEKIFREYLASKQEYISTIDKLLDEEWEWTRINTTTMSIMLEAIAEYKALQTPKLVLIKESVKTAQFYCGDEDYKIINALLDNYFRSCS